MRKVVWLVLASLAACVPAPALAWDTAEMNAAIDKTNFLVNDGCSGTLVDLENRYILTANHCVAEQYETIEREKISDDGVVTKEKIRRMKPGTASQFTFTDATATVTAQYRVTVKAVDSKRDLALLQVMGPLPNKAPAMIACAAPVRGAQVYVVGNPMGILYSSVTVGIVSSVQRTYESIGFPGTSNKLTQISAGVISGNSGGAVYNYHGELVGVPVLASRINEVIAFAVPHDEMLAFLMENKVEFKSGCAK